MGGSGRWQKACLNEEKTALQLDFKQINIYILISFPRGNAFIVSAWHLKV